jgi:hypothetical protein
MAPATKLIHFTILDANEDEIKAFGMALNQIKEKLPFEVGLSFW